MKKYKKYLIIISVINMLLLLFRILYVTEYNTDLHSEETQYWLWSKNLSLSYYSKPPLIAYINYISTSILGDNEMGVRINAIIIGFILPYLVYYFTKTSFKDSRAAFIAVLILFAMPFYHHTSLLFTTDSLLILFWTTALITGWQAFLYNKNKYWIATGIAIGLGFLSKYTILLFIPFIIVFVYLYKKDIFKKQGIYITMFVALLICTPVIIWNIENEFVTVKHIFHLSRYNQAKFEPLKIIGNLTEYIGGQILVLSPFFIGFIFKGFLRKNACFDSTTRLTSQYLKLSVLLVWTVFIFVAVKKIEMNWLLFAYPAIPILMSVNYLQKFKIKKLIIPIVLTFITLLLILFPVLFDKFNMGHIYPPKMDTFYRMSGWKDLGQHVSNKIDHTHSDKVFVFSDNYHIASELSFYVEGQPQTYVINLGRRMNQFDLWEGIEQFESKPYSAIYVSGKPAPAKLISSFRELKEYETFNREYREKTVQTLHIYLFENLIKHQAVQPDKY